LYEDWLTTVISEALKKRNTQGGEEEKGEFVVVSTEFFNELKEISYLSST